MGMFDPWTMGQKFGGILGGVAPDTYSPQDIEALIKGYGPQWGNLPRADAPQIPADPSGSTPIGASQPNPYGNPAGLMPTFTSTIPAQDQQQQAGGPWIRPNSFLDKLFGQPQISANAAPAPQQQPSIGSGAEPSAAWGAPAPQMANVPMPPPRPPGLGQPQPPQQQPGPPLNILPPTQNASLPPNAQPTQGQAPALAQSQPDGPDFGSRMLAGANNFSDPHAGLIARLANGFQGFQTGQNTNPAMQPKIMETGTDPNTGQKTFATYDARTGKMTPVGSGQGTGNPGQNNGFLAPGVPYLNSSATGEDYLKQWSPEVQSAAKAYLAGNIVPTGNPRQNALASKGKEVAIKYSTDMGVPFSDAKYAEARKFRTELGSTQANTVGGQAKAFNQGIEHMHVLGTTLEKLDNSNGLGIPWIADVINSGRQLTSTEQSAISDKARGIGQTLSGEVGKLFSGSAGGGVEERRLTRDRFDTVKSPKQLAAALEGTLETMRGGLTALEQRRDQVLGPNGTDVKFVEPATEKKIAQIEATIARLKGEKTESAPASAGWSVKKL